MEELLANQDKWEAEASTDQAGAAVGQGATPTASGWRTLTDLNTGKACPPLP